MASQHAGIDDSDHNYDTSKTIDKLLALGVIQGGGEDDDNYDAVIKKNSMVSFTEITYDNDTKKQRQQDPNKLLEKFDSLNEPPLEDDNRWTENSTITIQHRPPGAERIYPTGVVPPPSISTINTNDTYSSRNVIGGGNRQLPQGNDDDDDDEPPAIIATLVTDSSRRISTNNNNENDEPVIIAIAHQRKCFEVHMSGCSFPKYRKSTKILCISLLIFLLLATISVIITHPSSQQSTAMPYEDEVDDMTLLPTTTSLSPTTLQQQQPTPSPGQILLPLGSSIYGKGADCYTGYVVSLSSDGHRVAMGSLFGDSGKGMIQVFEQQQQRQQQHGSSEWSPMGGPIMQTQMSLLSFKGRMSLSGNGDVVAIHATDPLIPFIVTYRFVNGDWRPMGSRRFMARCVSLSSDGLTLAIANERYEAQVFEFDDDGGGVDDWVGRGNVTIGRRAMVVKLSGDGKRLVVSDYEWDDGRGDVRVFELSHDDSRDTTATIGISMAEVPPLLPLGDPLTASQQQQQHSFGYDLSISYDGSLIAIGTHTGNYVRVVTYDPLSNRWITIDTLKGETIDTNTFGATVSLSGSGRRLAVGSGGYMIGTGRGIVYEWNEITEKYEKYDDDDDDKDGIMKGDGVEQYEANGIAISEDGRSVAVGAPFVDNIEGVVKAGRVRVFRIW